MRVVIDADQMVYACGFATEGEPLSHTLQSVKKQMEKIMEETRGTWYELFISGEENFREDVAQSAIYKGNRVARKPTAYHDIREFLITRYEAQVVNGMEADDAVSIELWTDFVKTGGDPHAANVILSSPDKDLNNTPGWHYNPQKGLVKWITEEQAGRHFWYQMVMGDSTDNIPGIPCLPAEWFARKGIKKPARGCGKATAKALLSQSTTVYDAAVDVVDAYLAFGRDSGWSAPVTKWYLNEQGSLLWMVRELDELGNPVIFQLDEGIWNEGRRRHDECYFSERLPGEEEAGGPGNQAEEAVRDDSNRRDEDEQELCTDSVL